MRFEMCGFGAFAGGGMGERGREGGGKGREGKVGVDM